jgi:hypothetical protein
MRHFALQTLTWGTVTAAVTSALWLAASDPGWPESRKSSAGRSSLQLPKEPTGAGPAAAREAAADAATVPKPQSAGSSR